MCRLKTCSPPRPSNLITVPACGDCNHGASDDDEVFRNELSIMAGSFGESAKAAERLRPAMRGIRRNRATLRRMVLGAKPVERYSMGGIYLGLGYAVAVVPGVQERVIKTVALTAALLLCLSPALSVAYGDEGSRVTPPEFVRVENVRLEEGVKIIIVGNDNGRYVLSCNIKASGCMTPLPGIDYLVFKKDTRCQKRKNL
jgi:hypothetical protein